MAKRRGRPPSNRTCDVEGCEAKHRARGLCYQHYRWKYEAHDATCVMCGKEYRASRASGKFCSNACKSADYTPNCQRLCRLPKDHPAMILMAEVDRAARAARREMLASARENAKRDARSRKTSAWRTARECPGCACMFTPLYTSTMLTCSKRCSRRVHRWRRRASEANAFGTYTWSEFMRIAQRFNFRCAYCDEKPPGQLEPDHVVPLSRGGINSTTNLLPACRACNGDKRDLLLAEWQEDRERLGKPPRMTNWAPEDKRFWHLTQALLARPA